MMHIAFCGPMSLRLLKECLDGNPELPRGYEFPLMAYLVKALLVEGVRVTVVTSCCDVQQTTMWAGPNLQVFATPRRNHLLFFLDAYHREVSSMCKVLKDVHPDLVHANWTYEFANAALKSGCPHLVTAHDSPWTAFWMIRNMYTLYRTLYSTTMIFHRLKNISFVSDYIQKECAKYHRLPIHQYVIPNGISSSLCASQPHLAITNTSAPKFICVSGGGRLKNVSILAQAFSLVRNSIPNAHLTIVGLMDCGQLGDGVDSLGRLPHDEVLSLLRMSDIFVNTTLSESFCMTVLEAMAQGLPCIGGNMSGAVPWLLGHGEAGLLVDVKSPAAIAEGMIRMVKEPSLYSRLARNALVRVNQLFTIESVAKQYCSAYSDVLKKERSGR